MRQEIEILLGQERAYIDALDSLLEIKKAFLVPDVFSHLRLAKRLLEDAEEAWYQRADGSSPLATHKWAVLTLRSIESAGEELEEARIQVR